MFDEVKEIYRIFNSGNEQSAREQLIRFLDTIDPGIDYPEYLNTLIRELGLFPYIHPETATFNDKIIYEIFKANTGDIEEKTLHIEQSTVLKLLLEGKDIAVSAPTSFGKSFVIDAYIAIKKPKNIVIIVPTISLMDETRRRLYKKFGREYKIITTGEATLAKSNIFVFPQERALQYAEKIEQLDLFIVDEFYKAGETLGDERSHILKTVIGKFQKIADQSYFLAPNIKDLKMICSPQKMSFHKIDFTTVFTEIVEFKNRPRGVNSENIRAWKQNKLIELINNYPQEKFMIYTSGPTFLDRVTSILKEEKTVSNSKLNMLASDWVSKNYLNTWSLVDLLRKGIGFHNGSIHRSLGQIIIKLFEEENGLDTIVSTSSMIEGVNTSAKNVIIWNNKIGNSSLNEFTFKNIIGRSGRMFRHFVGRVFLLDNQISEDDTLDLELDFSDEVLEESHIDHEVIPNDVNKEKEIYMRDLWGEIKEIFGQSYLSIFKENHFSHDLKTVRDIAKKIQEDTGWGQLIFLNNEPDDWYHPLMKILNMNVFSPDTTYKNFVETTQQMNSNWSSTIPALLRNMRVGIDDFFKIERRVSYNLAATLNDINILLKYLIPNENIDISPFIAKASNAFLPPLVFTLEEYGLPRIISRKIHNSNVIVNNLESRQLEIYELLSILQNNKLNILSINQLDGFDKYILKYFYEGIEPQHRKDGSP